MAHLQARRINIPPGFREIRNLGAQSYRHLFSDTVEGEVAYQRFQRYYAQYGFRNVLYIPWRVIRRFIR